MGIRRGKQGTSTAGIDYSPDKLKRIKKAKQRQEQRWTDKASEVVTRTATPEEIEALLNKEPQ